SSFKDPYTPQKYRSNATHAGPSQVSPTLERVKARQQRSCASHRPAVLQDRRPNASLPTTVINGSVSSSSPLDIPASTRIAHSSPATTPSNTSSYSRAPIASAEDYDPFIASPTLGRTPRSDPLTPSSTILMTPRSSLLLAPSTPSATSHLSPFALPTPPLTPSQAVANSPSAVFEGRTKAVVQHAKTGLLQKATVPAFTSLPHGYRERRKSAVTTPAVSPAGGRTTLPPTPTTPLRFVVKSKSATATTALDRGSETVSTQGLGLLLDIHPVEQTSIENSPALASEPSTLPWPTPAPTTSLRLNAKALRAGSKVGSTQYPKATTIHRLESTLSPQQTSSAQLSSERDRLRNLELETLVLELSMKLDAEKARSAGFEKRIDELEATASSAELSPVNFAVGILRAVPKERRCCKGFTKTLRTGIRALSASGRKKQTGPQEEHRAPAGRTGTGSSGQDRGQPALDFDRMVIAPNIKATTLHQRDLTKDGVSEEKVSTRHFASSSDRMDSEDVKAPLHTLEKAVKHHSLRYKMFDNKDSDVELE
ncbi:hypothetical protein FRB90_007973, partial [Tulasnella sp. 427]